MTTMPQAAPLEHQVTAELGVLRVLFERLHAEGIRYCHWKSNEHLDASLVGKTDVDVLVDRRAIVPLTRLLGLSNFKRFVVKPGRGYPGIEDYVGFDPETGALTHLHVHYQLTLGEKFLKGHRLPWEPLYLSTRVMDEQRGIYVADPHLELVVLVLRAAIKLRARDFLIQAAGIPYFRGGLLREFRWLAKRVRPEGVAALANRLIGARAGALFPAMIAAGSPSLRDLVALRRTEPRLQEYRLYGEWEKVRHAWGRELGIIRWKLKNWYLRAPTKSTRTLPQGGLTVAVVGADGAGKSTLVAELAEWLSHEIAVVCTYGGSGKGSAGLVRGVLHWGAGLRRRLFGYPSASARRKPHPPETGPQPIGASVSFGRAIWVRALARERRLRALESRRARSRGMIVLSDRLPQTQFPGWNDGPRLDGSPDHPWWYRAAAREEQEAFHLAELIPPDLVLKLHVSPEVATRRKPETPAPQILTGVDMVRRLSFPAETRVVDIDGSLPFDQVLLQAKRAVWDAI